MTYQIETEADLIKALKECRDGDIIQSADTVVYTGNHIVDKNIIIMGYYDILTKDRIGVEKHQPFLTITKGAKIMGGFYGAMPSTPTDFKTDGLQTAIRIDGASYVDFYDCYFECFNYMAIHAFDCTMVNIKHSEIRLCATKKEKYGFGYGIWKAVRATPTIRC